MLPISFKNPIKEHLKKVKLIHNKDLNEGFGEVYLPYALEQKYPNANKQWIWQYVFPASRLSVDPRSGKIHRHHEFETNLQRAVKEAIKKAEVNKAGSCHTLRHSFATHSPREIFSTSSNRSQNVQSLLRLCITISKRPSILCWVYQKTDRTIADA